MEKVINQDKLLEAILTKLLEPNLKVNIDWISKLIEMIKKSEINAVTNQTRIYTNWIDKALSQWKYKTPDLELSIFLVELCSILCQNEIKFVLLHRMNTLDNLIRLLNLDKPTMNIFLKIAFIKLLHSCQTTKFGVEWLMTSSNHWSHIYIVNDLNTYEAIKHDLTMFIADLFFKIVVINRLFVMNVIQSIIHPLVIMSDTLPENISVELEIKLYHRVKVVLKFVKNIFEYFIKQIKEKTDYKLVIKYNNVFNFEECLIKILKVIKSKQFTLEVSQLLFPIYFFDLAVLTDSNQTISLELIQGNIEKVLHVFRVNINRGYVCNVLHLCYTGCIYRRNMYLPPIYLSGTKSMEPFLFENQLLLFQLAPILTYDGYVLGKNFQQALTDNEYREEFIYKLLKSTHQLILHCAYHWRNLLYNCENLLEEAIVSLRYLLKSIKIYTKNSAIIVFQTLVYICGDMVNDLGTKALKQNAKEFECLSLLMENLIKFIEEFDFTWKESIETIDVMNISSNILNIPHLKIELVVKSLQLIELSISKQFSPNLALLIDTHDSNMHFIGPLLYAKLRDSHLEVRKSGFKVLLTIAENGKTKFPYFQKILLESELPILAVKVVMSREDTQLKKIALKCLKHIAMINEVWDELVNTETFQDTVLQILGNKSERKIHGETIDLLVSMYENEYFSENFQEDLYKVLCMVGINETDNNIRLAALNFWLSVIKWHLSQEGYMDHEFPKIIFSKKLRKIIVLNDQEIRKRLMRTMDRFSKIGCLAVLLSCKLCDNNSEVNRQATLIIDKLIKLLNKYNIHSTNIDENICGSGPMFNNLEAHMNLIEINLDYLHLFNNTNVQLNNEVQNKILNPKDFLNAVREIDMKVACGSESTIDEYTVLFNSILSNLSQLNSF